MSSRTMLAVLTVALLAIGVGILVTQDRQGEAATYAGGFIKSGLVLGALWLALPQLTAFFQQTPRWLLIAGGVGIAVATLNWQLLLVIVPVVGALWWFGPRFLASTKAKVLPTIISPTPPPGRRARRKREAE